MKRRLATICLVTIFLIGFASPFVHAQDADINTANLKGVKTVYVLIEDLPDSTKTLGLSEDAIQTDVELKLRLAGIAVATQEETVDLPGRPFLYVEVNATDPIGAASINVSLIQDTVLARNGQMAPALVTWQTGTLLANPTAQLIRDQIKNRLDTFVDAWLSVNPQEAKPVRRKCTGETKRGAAIVIHATRPGISSNSGCEFSVGTPHLGRL